MKQLGPYILHDRIARGGMGEIYLATLKREGGFEKLLAVKRILPHLADDVAFVRMFESEARLSALLNHRNIVHIYDFGKVDDDAFLAMEFVDGFDLRSLLDLGRESGRCLSVGLALRIAGDCARALDYAHRKEGPDGQPMRIIHRDISPQNVLLSMEGEVKVTDFGLAKTLTLDPGSMSGTLKGKLAYMAPEQIQGDALDQRTDLFALGAVLFEMLSYVRVYPPDLPMAQLVRRVTRAEHPSLDELRPDLPEPVRDIVRRCLAPSPSDRVESAARLERQLRDVATSLGIAEPTYSLSDYLRPFAGRRKVIASVEEDGTVVSRKPIVQRSEPTPALQPLTLADTRVAVGRVGTQGARPLEAAPEPPAPSMLRFVLGAVGLASLLAGLTVWLVISGMRPLGPLRAPQRALQPIAVVEPVPPPPTDGTVPSGTVERRAALESQRRPARAVALPAPSPEVVLTITGVPEGASCFVLDLLRDEERAIRCGGATLPAGPYRLVVSAPAYQTLRKDVLLSLGQPARLELTLQRPPARPCAVTVTTEPAGARVNLDGQAIKGETPLALPTLQPGAHELRIRRAGYHPESSTIECNAETKPTLHWALREQRVSVRVGGHSRTLRPGGVTKATLQVGSVRATFRVTATTSGAKVQVDARPFARVHLNGRDRGATPVGFSIGVGRSYRVGLIRDGKQVGSVRVRAGFAGP